MKQPSFKTWTPEEEQVLREMKALGRSNKEIGERLDRTAQRVCDRWRWINMSPEQKFEKRYKSDRVRRAAKRREQGIAPKFYNNNVSNIAVPPDVMVEREKRLAASRTLSASLLGDPPTGFSALDRKQAGIVDVPHLDASQAQHQRKKPTLAWQPITFSGES